MSNGRFTSFLRFLKGVSPSISGKSHARDRFNKKAQNRVLGNLEILEDRSVPATLYVDLPGMYTITNDTGSKGLTTGDTVTWNGATAKTGLIYGTTAFGSVATAEAASGNNDTIKVNAAAYTDGAVSVNKDGQTFDIPANTTGFSILLTSGSNNSFTQTGAGSVNVVGNSGNNALTGNSGNNTLSGEGGADTITGGAGNDTISGGGGMDTAVFSGSRSNYTITVSGGTTTVVDNRSGSPDGTDTLTGVEKIKFNGDGTTVRNVPSSLGFTVGTSSQAATTSLVFGTSMIDPDSTQNGGKPTIVFQLSGNTTDGYFSAVNDGTVTINVSMSNLQLQGTPAALNAYLNSGNIKYNSLTSATRTITMQVDDNQNANGYVNLVANTGTTPVFTSANNTSVTYGQSLNFTIAATATPAATYSVTTGTLPSGVTLNPTSGVLSGTTAAGTYSFTVTATSGSKSSTQAFTLTVNKVALTVTAAAKSKTYGDADPALTYSITTGALVGSDSLTGSLTRASGENAGTYAINQGTLAASSNYTVIFVSANLTVSKATLSITAAAKSKTYGDADPSLTYTVSGLKNSDTSSVVTGSLTRTAGENAGTYAINQGTVVASANYNVTFTSANLTIGKRAATITATNVTGTYGTATLGSAFTIANLASGETVGSVTLATNATLSGAGKYNAGSWTITPSAATGGNFNANNYTFTYANGTFTVNKATLTVTAIGANKNYDGNTSATVTLSNDDLVGDVVVANAASKTFADATVGFGKTITVSGLTISGADAANYTLASTSTTTTGNIIGSGIVNNKLVIVGTGFDDEIIIAINPKNTTQIYVTWKVNGASTTTPYSIVGLTGVNVHGGDGNDKLTLNAEVPLTATFYGDNGNDTLRGGNYNDTLYGNDGNDTLYGSLGDDYLDGGAGSDTLNGQDGNDILIAGLEDNLPNILDGGAGSDTLTGSNGDDTLTGGTNSATDGADTIYGLGGNDKIVGGAGNDIIDGGTGDDNIDGGDGNDSINVGDGNNIVNGSYGDDTIVAGNGNNTLNGNDGNDTITAGNGNNALNGGGGNDVITGGHGNNTVWAGDGNDTVTVGNGNNLVIGAMGDDTITAGNGNNILVGEMGNDTITAGSGNNVIVGGGGLDTIKTGNGNNLVIGGSTVYDETDPSLRSILNEWVRTDITTAQKKLNLANGVGSGNAVKLVAGKTVIDDLLADKVFLGTGDNWLWF